MLVLVLDWWTRGSGTFKGGGGVMEQVVVGVPAGCDMIRDINMICATRYVF